MHHTGLARGEGWPRPAAWRPLAAATALGVAVAVCGARAADGADPGPEDFPPNGGFEHADAADPRRPVRWDLPDELGVQWVDLPGGEGGGAGKAIRIDTSISEQAMVAQWRRMGIDKWDIPNPAPDAIAATYGLSFYSDAMPVESGQAYRVDFDYRGPSGGAKLWVRGYGMFRGRKMRRYETIVNCRVPDEGWHHFSQLFHPTRLRPEVSEMKVMLYAYWPPGVYWFDNVRIDPVPAAEYEAYREENKR
jgi:hypothetical protein